MKNTKVGINKNLVGSVLTDLFSFYVKSFLDYNSLYLEYQNEANLFLKSMDVEFKEQFIVDFNQNKDYLYDSEKGAYLVTIEVTTKEKYILLFDTALGFTNFCQVVKNVLEGAKEPEPLVMERQASPPTKSYGVLPGNGVTTTGGGSF